MCRRPDHLTGTGRDMPIPISLASVDSARQSLRVRRTIEGGSREELHLRVGDLLRAERERAA